jgi:hypothetical protein
MSNPYRNHKRPGWPDDPDGGRKLTIGRQEGNDVVLEDTQSSRNHCLIEHVGGDYVLRDLARKMARASTGSWFRLSCWPDDVITIGQTSMKFVVPMETIEEVDVLGRGHRGSARRARRPRGGERGAGV